MLILSAVLRRILPQRMPEAAVRYGQLLRSTIQLAREEPVLRRRSLAQALMFAAFSCFWTSITYQLVDVHHLSQLEIAGFALVGAGGAAAALVAGVLGDSGHGQIGRLISIVIGFAAMALAMAGAGSVLALAGAAVLLDLATQGNQVLSQRDIYALRETSRARINTIYMTSAFIGGSIGSAVSGWLHAADGWTGVTLFGAALPLLAALLWVYDVVRERRARSLLPAADPDPYPASEEACQPTGR